MCRVKNCLDNISFAIVMENERIKGKGNKGWGKKVREYDLWMGEGRGNKSNYDCINGIFGSAYFVNMGAFHSSRVLVP